MEMFTYQILISGALQQLLIEFLRLVGAHFERFLYCTDKIVSHRLQHRLFISIGGVSGIKGN